MLEAASTAGWWSGTSPGRACTRWARRRPRRNLRRVLSAKVPRQPVASLRAGQPEHDAAAAAQPEDRRALGQQRAGGVRVTGVGACRPRGSAVPGGLVAAPVSTRLAVGGGLVGGVGGHGVGAAAAGRRLDQAVAAADQVVARCCRSGRRRLPPPVSASLPGGPGTTPGVPAGATPRMMSARLLPASASLPLLPTRSGCRRGWCRSPRCRAPPGGGRAGVGQRRGYAVGPPVDDRQAALQNRCVGQRVGPGVAEDVVVAQPADDGVVVCAAVDDRGAEVLRPPTIWSAPGPPLTLPESPASSVSAPPLPLIVSTPAGVVVTQRRPGRHRAGDGVRAAAAGEGVVAVAAHQALDVAVDGVVLDGPSGRCPWSRLPRGRSGRTAVTPAVREMPAVGHARRRRRCPTPAPPEKVSFCRPPTQLVVARLAVDLAGQAVVLVGDDAGVVAVAEVHPESGGGGARRGSPRAGPRRAGSRRRAAPRCRPASPSTRPGRPTK